MNFDDIRNMTDKDLAEWLEKIWKTGFTIGKLNDSTIKDAPDFYNRLKEEK